MRKTGILSALLALALTACGGADDSFVGGTGGGGQTPATTVGSLTLVASSPTVPSDGSTPAQISAFVRDASNKFMKDVAVVFSASSGGLIVTQGTTDANGLATATLSSAGDPAKRTITVTAVAGNVTKTINVDVTGTTLTVQGPAGLTVSQQGTYTIKLVDSGNHAVANQTVTVASQRNNTLSAASVTTDSTGAATFKMTASNSSNDTITVTALGLTATQAVTVNSDSFTVTAAAAEVPLGTPVTVTVHWKANNVPVANTVVNFATTRGVLSSSTSTTDAAGDASVTVTATNAGGAVVSASSGASTAQVPIEFVATTVAQIEVQPSAFTIATNQTSNITAVARDAAGNLVKNKTVVFTLDDVSGGTLSVGSAQTDSQGRAQTVYTSSNSTSANQGVKITATEQVSGVFKQVALTVAKREVFLSIGTGNELSEPNTAQYKIEYIVQVTDSNGNGVANVPVSLRILSDVYYKGRRVAATAPATGWATVYTATGTGSVPGLVGYQGCPDEDTLSPLQYQRNGILDVITAGIEDYNGNGHLDAGNIAAVTPSNATTNADGFVVVNVFYPQEYAYYLDVSLSASASVQGTEYVRTSRFTLPGLSTDFNDSTKAPPGPLSPFGVTTSCSNPN